MWQLLAVGAGGAIGAIGRFAVNGWAQRQFPAFAPAGTLIVNVAGCLAIGIVTGILGGLTTFSAFGLQTVELALDQQLRQCLLNIAANLILGCAAVWAGLALTRALLTP
jgi:CrcB protein